MELRVARLRRVLGAFVLTGLVVAPVSAHADDPAPPPRTFTVAVTGDILAHTMVNDQASRNAGGTSFDYRPMFAEVQARLSGVDLAICHLEGPIAPPGKKITGQPRFASPPAIAQSIADVGYDRCSTASNHTMDQGIAGIKATLDALDGAGLGHSGSARTPAEAVSPVLEVNGVKVVHLSYAFGFNSGKPRKGEEFRANLIDVPKILADATDARTRGAEVVLVSLHWGAEFHSTVTKAQRDVANALTSSGLVDLIIGHHAHVIQPIEQINGKWVIFGLGNILSNQRPNYGTPPPSQDGEIVEVRITENAGGGFTVERPVVTPTWVLPGSYRILPVLDHLEDQALPAFIRRELKKSIARTMKVVGAFVPA